VPESPAANVDLTADCLGMFARKVQPILMNTCAQCHTPNHPGAFKLERAYEVTLENRKTLGQNLAAVLAQVNFNQPQASPLLTKAVSDHGRVGQPPIRSRQVPAYRALEDWVQLTLDNNPQLRPPGAAPAGPEPAPSPAARSETAWGEDAGRAAPAATPAGAAPAATPAGPPDPFDPEEFNRLAHPEKARGQ
jgi:hypothetical protein